MQCGAHDPTHVTLPNEGEIVGHLKAGEPVLRYAIDEPTADMTVDVLAMVLYAGQGVGLTNEDQPVAEIQEEMAVQACEILARLAQHRSVERFTV